MLGFPRGRKLHPPKRSWQQVDHEPSVPVSDSVDCCTCASEPILFCSICKQYFCLADFVLLHAVESTANDACTLLNVEAVRECAAETPNSKSRHRFRLLAGVPDHILDDVHVGWWEHKLETQHQLRPKKPLLKPRFRSIGRHLTDGLLMTCFPLIAESLSDLFVLARVCKQWARCSTSPVVLGQTNLETQCISDRQCGPLGKLVGLRKLKVRGRKLVSGLGISDYISDAGVRGLAALTSLQDLRLTCTWATDEGCRALSVLSGLRRLDLCEWSKLTSLGCFASLSQLTSFKLSLHTITPALICSLAGLTTLQKLSLTSRAQDFISLHPLTALSQLTVLQLKEAIAEKGDIGDLSALGQLTALDMGGRALNIGHNLKCATTYPNLQALNLCEKPMLWTESLDALTSISSLRWLGLVGCHISTPGLFGIKHHLLQLVFLDLTSTAGYDMADLLSLVKGRPEMRVAQGKQDLKKLGNGMPGQSSYWFDPCISYDFYDHIPDY